jgi:hypothetical protein
MFSALSRIMSLKVGVYTFSFRADLVLWLSLGLFDLCLRKPLSFQHHMQFSSVRTQGHIYELIVRMVS